MSGASISERFAREARAIAAMEHPHILPVYDYGEKDGLAYLVMAYAPNGSLQEALTPSSPNFRFALPLSLELAGTILEQAAQALQHAHDRGVLHRDIKPANFLLGAPAGSGGLHLLLADFGLAKFAAGGQSSALYAGTVAYSAPEQIQRQATPASDQYGLAVMIYLLLTGRLPFTGDAAQILFQQMQVPAPSLRTFTPTLPAEVDAVMLRALAKKPEERWPSVATFAAAYKAALGGQQPAAQVARGPSWQTGGQGMAPVGPQGAGAALIGPPPAFPSPVQFSAPQAASAETIPTMHPPVYAPTAPLGSGPQGGLPFPSAAQQRTVPGPFGGESVMPGISPPQPYFGPPAGGRGRPPRRWAGIVGGVVVAVALILAVVLVVNLLGAHGKTVGTTSTGTTPGTGGTPGSVTLPGSTSGPHISNVQTGLFLDPDTITGCNVRLDPNSPATTTFHTTDTLISVVFTAQVGSGDAAPAAVAVLIDSQQKIVGGGNAQGDGVDLTCQNGKGSYALSVPISGQNVKPGNYFIGISYIPDSSAYLSNPNKPLPNPEAGVPVQIMS
jgi:serine/threonine-protein kinase